VAQLITCIYLHWTDRYAYFYYVADRKVNTFDS
jgi:hypothetical protein